MLDRGKDLDWFQSWQIVTLAIVAVVGCRDLRRLGAYRPAPGGRSAAVRGAATSGPARCAMSLGYGTFFGNVVLLPLWLQQYMGYTATMAGMVLAPVGVFAILLTPLVGRNIDKVDPRWFATGAFAILGAGAGDALALQHRRRLCDADPADASSRASQLAVFFIPLITLALSGLPPRASRQPRACSILPASRRVPSAPQSPRRSGTGGRASITRNSSSTLRPMTPRRRRRFANLQAERP